MCVDVADARKAEGVSIKPWSHLADLEADLSRVPTLMVWKGRLTSKVLGRSERAVAGLVRS